MRKLLPSAVLLLFMVGPRAVHAQEATVEPAAEELRAAPAPEALQGEARLVTRAPDASTPAPGEPSADRHAMMVEVYRRIVEALDPSDDRFAAALSRYGFPDICMKDHPLPNAGVGPMPAPGCREGEGWLQANGRFQTRLTVTSGLNDRVVRDVPARFAMVLGHELAHVLLGHLDIFVDVLSGRAAPRSLFVYRSTSREEELEADRVGIQLAQAAGYAKDELLSTWHRFDEAARDLGLHYSSFEGLGRDHPSTSERLAALDEPGAVLWRSMSVFDDGVFFLRGHRFEAASAAFHEVVKAWPRAWDAWANLGHADLMRYADLTLLMTPEQRLRTRVRVDSYYERPASLMARIPRAPGVRDSLWRAAVAALERAIELQPLAVAAKSDLALARLLAPRQGDPDLARRLFADALEALPDDTLLSSNARAAIWANAAAADLEAGAPGEALRKLERARELSSRGEVLASIEHNSALAALDTGAPGARERALDHLEGYLSLALPADVYWEPAYELYRELADELGRAPRDRDALVGRRPRPFVGVVVDGHLLRVGDPIREVTRPSALGPPGIVLPVIRGGPLRKLIYPLTSGSLAVIGDGRRVVAIAVRGPARSGLTASAPGPTFRLVSLAVPHELDVSGRGVRLGMPTRELKELLEEWELDCDNPQQMKCFVDRFLEPQSAYVYFYDLGLAVKAARRGGEEIVEEIVVLQVPYCHPAVARVSAGPTICGV